MGRGVSGSEMPRHHCQASLPPVGRAGILPSADDARWDCRRRRPGRQKASRPYRLGFGGSMGCWRRQAAAAPRRACHVRRGLAAGAAAMQRTFSNRVVAASSHGGDPASRRSTSSASAVTAGVHGPDERGIPNQAASPAVAYGWVEARHGVGIVAILEQRCHPCHTPRPWCSVQGRRQRNLPRG